MLVILIYSVVTDYSVVTNDNIQWKKVEMKYVYGIRITIISQSDHFIPVLLYFLIISCISEKTSNIQFTEHIPFLLSEKLLTTFCRAKLKKNPLSFLCKRISHFYYTLSFLIKRVQRLYNSYVQFKKTITCSSLPSYFSPNP